MGTLIKQADFLLLFLFFILTLTVVRIWAKKNDTISRAGVTLLFILFLFLTSPLISNYFVFRLENRFPPLLKVKNTGLLPYEISYIVVLGSASVENPNWPITSQIGATTLIRLLEGIRIWKELPDAYLILSGGSSGKVPESDLMEEMAVSLGVEPYKIIKERTSKSTYEEAVLMKSLLRDQSFILVTTARHMPRAMAIFQKQNLKPIPAPTGFTIIPKLSLSLADFAPSFSNASSLNNILYEYLAFWKAYFINSV